MRDLPLDRARPRAALAEFAAGRRIAICATGYRRGPHPSKPHRMQRTDPLVTVESDPGDRYVVRTRAWVRRAVIGLNLCPFAKAVETKGRVRYVATRAGTLEALMRVMVDEMRRLVDVPEHDVETTLVIHPFVLTDFVAFNDFSGDVEARIDDLGFDGFMQLATFHPDYRFAGTHGDDLGNATNRSPYPTLQLLRESSVDRAVSAFPDAEAIYTANIATLERLGPTGWAAIERACRDDFTDPAS